MGALTDLANRITSPTSAVLAATKADTPIATNAAKKTRKGVMAALKRTTASNGVTVSAGVEPAAAVPAHAAALIEDGLPASLVKPPETPEEAAARRARLRDTVGPDRKLKAPSECKPTGAALPSSPEQEERERLKRRGADARRKAQKSGVTKAMPLTGKAALAAINTATASDDATEANVKTKANSKSKSKGKAKAAARKPVTGKTSSRGRYDYAAAEAAAKAGKLPPVPDFSANTHRYYRGTLDQAVALAKAGDVAGLKKLKLGTSTSPRAIDKYRTLAIIAIQAKK